ncbi:MAG: TonB-dependent receptor [Geothrix sp.]|nr:TonB-dependent receptor [Geothrix sp.]
MPARPSKGRRPAQPVSLLPSSPNAPKRPLRPLAFLLGLSGVSGALASEPGSPALPPSATVVVTASLAPGSLALSNREILILDAETIQRMPVNTLGEILALAATVDLQSRVPGGLFGDLRMRGTHYAGVLVCIDGVRWNDPQTGHFNLEIPIPMEMVDRIEVLTGSQCAFFGSEAVGGVINVITRRPARRTEARAEAGSYGQASAAGLVEVSEGPWHGRTFAGHARSDGFTANRGFGMTQAVAEAGRDLAQGYVRALYTFLDSRFGASGFYGNYPSTEATTGHGLLLSAVLDQGAFAGHATRLDATWRRHDDNFVLYKDRPDLYQNLHTNDTTQFKVVSVLGKIGGATLTGAVEASRDTLASARLGNRRADRLAGTLEAQGELAPGLTLQTSLRSDHYSTWGNVLTPGAGLTWFLSPRLKLRAAWGRAFRAPSFTELYYTSPAQIGNAALQPERADSVEGGADWYGAGGTVLSLTAFHRRDRDQIDWIRRLPVEPWTAANIGSVNVDGLSVSAAVQLLPSLRGTAGWTFTQQDIPPADYTSRYAPDGVRHQVSLSADADLGGGTRLATTFQYKQRTLEGPDPALLSFRLGRTHGAWEVYLQGNNLLDRRYEEIIGVPMPGRTFSLGLRWNPRKI